MVLSHLYCLYTSKEPEFPLIIKVVLTIVLQAF